MNTKSAAMYYRFILLITMRDALSKLCIWLKFTIMITKRAVWVCVLVAGVGLKQAVMTVRARAQVVALCE